MKQHPHDYALSLGPCPNYEFDLVDLFDPDIPGAGDVAPLPGPHHPMLPQSNRLRLLAATNRRQKLLLEKQHSDMVIDPIIVS